MKLAASIIKTIKENMRDWKVLVLVLLFSPFFVLLMYLFYGEGPAVYNIGILNLDGNRLSVDLIKTLENVKGQDGAMMFKLTDISDEDNLKAEVKEKIIDIGIVIPDDYTNKLTVENTVSSAVISFYGSMENMRYTVAAVMASDVITRQGMEVRKITLPSSISENFIEKKQPLNEFEGYVPGLISLAVLMVLFTACASIVKENDKKTLIRLKLSRLGAFNFLSGISIVQAAISVAAVALSYWTALALGYRPAGGFGAVLVVGIISSFSMVAVSLVVASFLNTIFDVLTIGCFPFFIMMFFSGSMFPIPRLDIITVGRHTLGITDILPLSHTADAFNKILNSGAGIGDVSFDIFMIALLTVIYFVIGLMLYRKRRLSKA